VSNHLSNPIIYFTYKYLFICENCFRRLSILYAWIINFCAHHMKGCWQYAGSCILQTVHTQRY
jgi:hypothetical protein